jgi:hypothetical protein
MKKQILGIGLCFYSLFIQNCSPKIQSYSAEVNFLYKEAQGTIGVKAIGYGENQESAVEDAQKSAFKILLFKGIPGTELNIPLIQNENEATSKNSNYFKKLFDEGYYKTFLMSSTESSNLIKIKGNKKITVDMKINYNSLRKDLENNLIIRKFGY